MNKPAPVVVPRPDTGMTRERLLVFVLAAATVLAFYVCYLIILPFIPIVSWALAIAIVARPLHDWIAARVKNPEVAAGLAVGVVGLLIIGPVAFVVNTIVREAMAGAQHVKAMADDGLWRERVEEMPWVGPMIVRFRDDFDLSGALKQAAGFLTQNLPRAVAGSVWVVVGLALVLFTLYFFFRDRRQVLVTVRSLMPLSETESDEVFRSVADTVHATVFGSLVVALVQGALGGLIFWLLGLPSPVLWAAVMALLAVVPNLGTPLVWGPAAVGLALGGDWVRAIILVVYGAAAIGMIDNLLYPYLVGSRLRLHTLAVFFSMLGGLWLMGAAGIILGPVTVAVTMALVDVWRRRTVGGKPAESAVRTG